MEYNSAGGFVRNFGSFGAGKGQLNICRGVALDSSGNVYASDKGNARVVEFTPTGGFIQNISSLGYGNGQISNPFGLAFDSNGNLYVVDEGNYRIVEFSKATFTGTVTLEGLGSDADQNIKFTFRPTAGGARTS